MELNDNFSNESIADLPKLESQPLVDISPKYRRLNLLVTVVAVVLVVGVLSAVRFQPFIELNHGLKIAYPFSVSIVFALGLWSFVYHFFADPLIGYCLREQDISLQKGLIFRSLSCQPILRIQHVEVKRGPLMRLAGLSALHVFSAGGALHTFQIPGLEDDTAQQLRQFILDHKALSEGQF